MIATKEVKIKIPENFTSAYIETELKNMGFDVLRWAITEYFEDYCKLNIAVVEC